MSPRRAATRHGLVTAISRALAAAALLFAGACGGGDEPRPPRFLGDESVAAVEEVPSEHEEGAARILGLVRPVRLGERGTLLDGGTCVFEIVDARRAVLKGAFDGRMDENSDFPRHAYLGARYPSDPGARRIPLFGAEERAVVTLLRAALSRELAADRQAEVLRVRNIRDLPSDVGDDTWHFLRALDLRRRTHAALDAGDVADRRATLDWFGAEEPPRLERLETGATAGEIVAAVRVGPRKTYVLTFPSAPEAAGAPSSWTFGGPRSECALGSSMDRANVTLAAVALERGVPSGGSSESLRAALDERKRRILASDATR